MPYPLGHYTTIPLGIARVCTAIALDQFLNHPSGFLQVTLSLRVPSQPFYCRSTSALGPHSLSGASHRSLLRLEETAHCGVQTPGQQVTSLDWDVILTESPGSQGDDPRGSLPPPLRESGPGVISCRKVMQLVGAKGRARSVLGKFRSLSPFYSPHCPFGPQCCLGQASVVFSRARWP